MTILLKRFKGNSFTFNFLTTILNKNDSINDLTIENILITEKLPIETSKLNYLIKKATLINEHELDQIKIYTLRKIRESDNKLNDTSHFNSALDSLILILNSLEFIISNRNYNNENNIKNKILKLKVLFLPTYRRIEQDSKDLFSEVISKGNLTMNFGINDVVDTLDKTINTINDHQKSEIEKFTKKSLSDLIGLRHISTTQFEEIKFSLDFITKVLNRFCDIITETDQKIIITMIKNGEIDNTENRYIRYYLFNLIKIYNEQEIFINQINLFLDTCNKYLIDKKFIASNDYKSIGVYKNSINGKKRIPYNNLSSGEKQIIAIFSKIYLSDLKEIDIYDPKKNNIKYFNSLPKYWILFDEPELSLSVKWQEKIMEDILASNNCDFLFSTTHSPFILSESIKKYASDLKNYREEI